MSSDAGEPRPNAPRVDVAIECQGPIDDECERVLRTSVVGFDGSGGKHRGIRCGDCGRITHATRRDVTGAGGDDGE